MNVTIGNVSAGSAKEMAAQPAAEGRKRSQPHSIPPAGESAPASSTAALEIRHSALEDLRSRLLLLQREVAKEQRVLGGLEEIHGLLRAPEAETPVEGAVQRYAATVKYQGQAVLEAVAEQLTRIARERDHRGLEALIEESRAHLGRLAQELSRFETAQQNSRALAAAGDPLESLKRGIQRQGGALLEVRRKNVLRLLS